MSQLAFWQDAKLPLPTVMDSTAIAHVNNLIYLFGGWYYDVATDAYDYNAKIYKLNLSSSSPSWTILNGTTLNHLDCRHQCSTVIQDRYVYIYHPANSQFHVFDAQREQFTLHSAKNQFDEYGCIISDPIHSSIYKIGQYMAVYNLSADTWNPNVNDWPAPPSSIEHESCVYHPESQSFFAFPHDNAVLQYDIASNAWSTPNPLSVPTQSKDNTDAVLAADDMIYIIGGTLYRTNPKHYLHAVDVYDPNANTLMPATPLKIVSGVAAVVAIHDKIYVFGGVNNKSEVSNPLVPFETTSGLVTSMHMDITNVEDAMEARNHTDVVVAAIGCLVVCLLLLLYFLRFRKSEDPTTFRHGDDGHTKVAMGKHGTDRIKIHDESDGDEY